MPTIFREKNLFPFELALVAAVLLGVFQDIRLDHLCTARGTCGR